MKKWLLIILCLTLSCSAVDPTASGTERSKPDANQVVEYEWQDLQFDTAPEKSMMSITVILRFRKPCKQVHYHLKDDGGWQGRFDDRLTGSGAQYRLHFNTFNKTYSHKKIVAWCSDPENHPFSWEVEVSQHNKKLKPNATISYGTLTKVADAKKRVMSDEAFKSEGSEGKDAKILFVSINFTYH